MPTVAEAVQRGSYRQLPAPDSEKMCTGRAQKMTPVGFEPTPFRNGALSHRLRLLGQSVVADDSVRLISGRDPTWRAAMTKLWKPASHQGICSGSGCVVNRVRADRKCSAQRN